MCAFRLYLNLDTLRLNMYQNSTLLYIVCGLRENYQGTGRVVEADESFFGDSNFPHQNRNLAPLTFILLKHQ